MAVERQGSKAIAGGIGMPAQFGMRSQYLRQVRAAGAYGGDYFMMDFYREQERRRVRGQMVARRAIAETQSHDTTIALMTGALASEQAFVAMADAHDAEQAAFERAHAELVQSELITSRTQ